MPWVEVDLKFEVSSDWFLPCISQFNPTVEEVTRVPAILSSETADYVALMICAGVRASWPCGCGFRLLLNK